MINKPNALTADTGYGYDALKITFGFKYFCRFDSLLLLIAIIYLNGCGTTKVPAPVVDREKSSATQSAASSKGDLANQYYVVQKGDTLHSIGATHGIDAKTLAEWNNISDPRTLRVGQRLNLYIPTKKEDSQPTLYALPEQPVQSVPEPTSQGAGTMVVPGAVASSSTDNNADASTAMDHSNVKKTPKAIKLPYSEQNMAQLKRGDSQAIGSVAVSGAGNSAIVSSNAPASIQPSVEKHNRIEAAPSPDTQKTEKNNHNFSTDWIWPTNGKLLSTFSKNSKGLKISGQSGQTILASAPGEVVYSGNGLRGYGNLIIIKHNNTYLSAYAHNSKILVKEGDSVIKGQKIAEMGNTDADAVQLHFEIRKNGKPVDPLIYLPSQP
ncbi:MAG: peptidoglycan DD-metalloendopeptidase family protein [Nitrosomonas sp.]